MTNLYVLFKRGKVYYCEDRATGKQRRFRTRLLPEARQLLQARNDSARQPLMNLALAKAYLAALDPELILRTWADVMKESCNRGAAPTRMRHARAMRSRPMMHLRDKRLVETTADDFLEVMRMGGNSTNCILQTLHNDALELGWLPLPILPRKKWPRVRKRHRRAITFAEHLQLVESFQYPEWGDYLELLWLTGASQTDAANLTSANIDWSNLVLFYPRAKLEGRGSPQPPSPSETNWQSSYRDALLRGHFSFTCLRWTIAAAPA